MPEIWECERGMGHRAQDRRDQVGKRGVGSGTQLRTNRGKHRKDREETSSEVCETLEGTAKDKPVQLHKGGQG